MESALAIGVNPRLTAGGKIDAMLLVALRHEASFAGAARVSREQVSSFAGSHQRLTIQDIEKPQACIGMTFAS
jgi:hypothetical protein